MFNSLLPFYCEISIPPLLFPLSLCPCQCTLSQEGRYKIFSVVFPQFVSLPSVLWIRAAFYVFQLYFGLILQNTQAL